MRVVRLSQVARNKDNNIPNALGYNYLFRLWKKGFRNGNWNQLNRIEKALYIASLSLARMRGRIVNSKLILELLNIIHKIIETSGDKLMITAHHRAIKIFMKFQAIGLFEWAPQVKSWFNDPSYIFWLGISSTGP